MRRIQCTLTALVLASALAPSMALGSTVTSLAPDVSWLRGDFDVHGRPDGNSVLIRGKGGMIVFDTGRHAAHAEHLVAAAKADALPITNVFNSHWHLDHVSGNGALRAAFPQLQVWSSAAIHQAPAQEFLARGRERMRAANLKEADAAAREERARELARSEDTATLRIDHVVDATREVVIDGREMMIGHSADAATGGDLWLLDRASGVLASGDLVTLPAPFLDTACPAGFRAALATIVASDFKLLVPGHGAPMRRRDVKRYQRAVDALFDCADTSAEARTCAAAWHADVLPLMSASERENAVPYAEYYVAERLRADPATLAADCGP
jgi:glyoxylase-like metal-dependent hydrolase (beta-lactamase superfamily II)